MEDEWDTGMEAQTTNVAKVYHHDMRTARDYVVEDADEPFDMYVRSSEDPHIDETAFSDLYNLVGEDPDATLDDIFGRWNWGSREEADVFVIRECEDCGKEFDASETRRGRDASVQVSMVEDHEEETGHTVEDGVRSLMVGDIVAIGGEVYLVAPIGFERQEHLDSVIYDE